MIEVFERMRNEARRSLIVISHQERILSIADEIVVVDDGKIADQGIAPVVLSRMMRDHRNVIVEE